MIASFKGRTDVARLLTAPGGRQCGYKGQGSCQRCNSLQQLLKMHTLKRLTSNQLKSLPGLTSVLDPTLSSVCAPRGKIVWIPSSIISSLNHRITKIILFLSIDFFYNCRFAFWSTAVLFEYQAFMNSSLRDLCIAILSCFIFSL